MMRGRTMPKNDLIFDINATEKGITITATAIDGDGDSKNCGITLKGNIAASIGEFLQRLNKGK